MASIDKQLSLEIFRAYDIRGVVGETLFEPVVHQIGAAIGSEAYKRGQQSVVVARDGRESSPALMNALIEGLRSSGCDVIDIGMVPTPVLYFATHHLQTNSGVMLTGSHNAPEYNGLKIVLDGEALHEKSIQAIRQRILSGDIRSGYGNLQSINLADDYIERIVSDISTTKKRRFKLVVDCGNGVAGELAPRLFDRMGHHVIPLYCEIDGGFPNHHPDPSKPENLRDLVDKVVAENADLGFAFDGDGDRIGVVDGQGQIIWPDRLMMVLAKDVLSRNRGATIIFDVKCSRHLHNIIEESGGKPLMWKTGHSLIKAKMKTTNALLAGEMSGHIFFKERWYGFDDALYTGARLLEIFANSEEDTGEILSHFPKSFSTPELRIGLPEKMHNHFMKILKNHIGEFLTNATIVDIDGVRADFPDGWGLIRPSNTSPYLVARFEGESQSVMERIQSQFIALIDRVFEELNLPYHINGK